MKPFMSKNCGHPHCRSVNCDKCYFYRPAAFGIRVPRWLGNLLYKLEWKMDKEVHLYGTRE